MARKQDILKKAALRKMMGSYLEDASNVNLIMRAILVWLVAFIDVPDMLYYQNMNFKYTCYALSSIIVVKWSKYLSTTIIGKT